MIENKTIDFLLGVTNINEIQQFLDKNVNLNLAEIRDEKKNNLIHKSVIRNKIQLIKIYIDHQKKYFEKRFMGDEKDKTKKVKNILQSWINQQNSEGFTPIHYACSKAEFQVVKLLEKFGANILAINKLGLNILHISAQANKIDPIIYFHEKIDLNSTDFDGMTPLHWSASMGSEEVATFLLSKKVQMNLLNKKRQTPLHLATSYGNTKIVRRLLMKGADKNLRNEQEQKPIEIAIKNQFYNIAKMLKDKYSILDHLKFYYNVQIKYTPQNRSLMLPAIFIILFVIITGTTNVFIQFEIDQLYLAIPIVYYTILFILYLSLIKQNKLYTNKIDIYQLINKPSICPQCNIIKKERSYHCQICKICIQRYDHHCPWINNCVGKKNLGRFILFLVMIIIGMAQIIAANGLYLFGMYCQFRFQQLLKQYYLVIIVKAISIMNLSITLLLFILLIPLLFVQIMNLFLNKTTFERFSKVNNPKKTESDSSLTESNITNEQSLLQKDRNEQNYSYRNCGMMCSNQDQK